MPFRLVLNHVSQFKYTNSLATNATYTDHNGVVHDVQQRNDIQLTRDVFYFSGYAFDTRLDYNILLFTSSATLVATAAGYAGFSVQQGVRAARRVLLAAQHPLDDRQLSVLSRHRPEHGDQLLPTRVHPGDLGERRAARRLQLHRDGGQLAQHAGHQVREHRQPSSPRRPRSGTTTTTSASPGTTTSTTRRWRCASASAFTFAREDRLSDLAEAGPENNATFISDGLFLFETGALAPDVTISLANFYLWAIDGGIKYKGLAFNVEFYMRWLNNFVADGPLPMSRMFDWGFDASLGYFVHPKLELFVRSVADQGPVRDRRSRTSVGAQLVSVRHAPGLAQRGGWPTSRIVPTAAATTCIRSGQTGFVVPVQFMLRF